MWEFGLDTPPDGVIVTTFNPHSFLCFEGLKLDNTTTLAKKIGTATRQRAQARDLSSMHALVVDVRACFNFFGQGSISMVTRVVSSDLVFDKLSEKGNFVDFQQGNKVFDFE